MNKPQMKDGYHFRWYYHPFGGWEPVHVGPWDGKRLVFSRPGISDSLVHWVAPTQHWQWGEKIAEPPEPRTPKWVGWDYRKCVALNKTITSGQP